MKKQADITNEINISPPTKHDEIHNGNKNEDKHVTEKKGT